MGNTIDVDLYASRIDRARAEMNKDGLDYLVVGPGSDLFYLTGYNAHLSERLNLLVSVETDRKHGRTGARSAALRRS